MNISDLDKLVELAKAAAANAYCPHSKFKVGAAVLTSDGQMFPGCNVENASYGLTICAERVAIFNAIASGARSIRAIVIYTPTKTPSPPCGACLQVMHEFGPSAEVLSLCDGTRIIFSTVKDLLPIPFKCEAG